MRETHPLQPRPSHLVNYHGEAVLIADRRGMIGNGVEGFYYRLTRFLSRLRLSIDGAAPEIVAAKEVSSYAAIAYYLAPSPAGAAAGPDPECGNSDEIVRKAIELQVNRYVGGGFCDEIQLINRALAPTTISIGFDIDADFADYSEADAGKRQQQAAVEREWTRDQDEARLTLRYRHPKLPHAVHVSIHAPGEISFDGKVHCRLDLAPQKPVRLRLDIHPMFCGERVEFLYDAARGDVAPTAATRGFELKLRTPVESVQSAWERAAADLASLAMLEGEGPEQRTPAAGMPKYAALFGRDVLITAMQSAFLDPQMLRGSLRQVAKWNATGYDDSIDAQPGRVIHQRQRSPLALLGKNPFLHYYGDYSAPGWFLIDVAWDYLLTGDQEFFRSMREKVLATLAWMDRDGDRDGDGFYEYATRAGAQGEKNQGWKDSSDAILYPDGRLVRDPIALVEIQGCYYAAKQLLAEVFEHVGERDKAATLRSQAARLKRRFNETFWLAEESFYALALDPEKKPVSTVASDAGQCLAYGIVDDSRAVAVSRRLMQPDLFSGWGLRTLSNRHPAFNPFAYHLGSVWPVANAIIAFGFKRYGFVPELHRLARAMFDATGLFEMQRLPEVFGGHQRDALHPHPGIYPQANTPQAWSAGAVILLIQVLLGLVPAAPWGALIVDPDLPEWLPEITLANLRTGDASVSIRFARKPDGTTEHEVIDQAGCLRVFRPSRRAERGDALLSQLRAVAEG